MGRVRTVVMVVGAVAAVLAAWWLGALVLRWALGAAVLLAVVVAVVASRRAWRLGAARLGWRVGVELLRAGRGAPREVLAVGVLPVTREPVGVRAQLGEWAAVSRQVVGVARQDARARKALGAFCRRLSPRARVVLGVLAACVFVVSVLACALVVAVAVVRAVAAWVGRVRGWLTRASARLEPTLSRLTPSRWEMA